MTRDSSRVGRDEGAAMLTALVQLRQALPGATLPLELPGAAEAARLAAGDGRPARGLRHPAGDDASTRRCSPSSAARPAPASRRWSTRSSAGGSPRPGVLRPDHPVAGAGAPPRRRRLVRPGPAAARPRAGAPRHRPTRARSSSSPSDTRPGRTGDPRRARHRLGRGAQPHPRRRSCWPRPTCGCSSPRPPATPTRCRGTSSRQAAERSAAVAIVLDRTPREAVETVADPPRPDAGQPRAEGLAAVHRHRGRGRRRRAAAARTRSPRCAALARRARRRRRGPRRWWSGRPWTARSAPSPAAPTRSPTPPTSRSGRRSGCASDADTAYDDAIAQVDEATADGTLLRGEVLARWQEFVGTGELLQSLETRVGLAARPDRQRRAGASRSRPNGSPSPSSPGSRR